MQTMDMAFIQNKIAGIGTALFFCDDKDMLPCTGYIVTALRTDDQGCIWFFISRSWNKTVSYEVNSAASLDFYRKGYPFSFKIDGRASLVNDKIAMRDFMQDLLGKSIPVKEEDLADVLLVRVKIENAEYKEFVPRKTFSPFKQIAAVFKNVWSPAQPAMQAVSY